MGYVFKSRGCIHVQIFMQQNILRAMTFLWKQYNLKKNTLQGKSYYKLIICINISIYKSKGVLKIKLIEYNKHAVTTNPQLW